MSAQLAIANIALDTATVSRQGFGTILFVGQHNYFSERIKAYTSTLSMAEDGIPTTSNIYIAAQGAFSQNPSPTSIKIGRQESTTALLLTNFVASTSSHTVTITANGIAESTVIVPANTTEELTLTDVKTAVDAIFSTVITATVVGTGPTATLTLAQVVAGTDWFTIKTLVNYSESSTSAELAATAIAAISSEDDAWYYFTAEDKTNAFVLAAAADIEAKLKVYRTSTFEAADLTSTPTGTIADLNTANYFRSSAFFHHEAATKFPEVAALAEIAPYVTGSVTYGNRIVAAVSPSQNLAGKDLTTTEQINLKKVNGDFFARVGNSTSDPVVTVVGKMASGEWIDNIVGRDNLQVDIEADFTNLLIRQKASKIAFNNKGANQLRSVLQTVLSNYTVNGTHNFIEDDFVILIPDQVNFNPADKGTRTFKQITFKATLTNAIHMVEITGTLSL